MEIPLERFAINQTQDICCWNGNIIAIVDKHKRNIHVVEGWRPDDFIFPKDIYAGYAISPWHVKQLTILFTKIPRG